MMHCLISRLAEYTLVALFMVLVGCATSQPTKFYILSPLPDSERGAQAAAGEQDIAIGLGPVDFPDYLDRSEIVTRDTLSNEILLSDFDMWAESPKLNFTRVLADNLSILLSTDQVALYPWRRSVPVQYQVLLDVIRFDGELGGDAMLTARWTVLEERDRKKKVLAKKKSTFREPTGAKSYEALVSAQSRTVAALSREIAEGIKAVL